MGHESGGKKMTDDELEILLENSDIILLSFPYFWQAKPESTEFC